jgi:hypothetical protein
VDATGALRSRYKIMSERAHARYGQSGRLPPYVYDSFHHNRPPAMQKSSQEVAPGPDATRSHASQRAIGYP